MIGYVTLGTNNIAKAAQFYDKLFEEIGGYRTFSWDNFAAWTTQQGDPMLGVILPANGEPATIGNGSMVALKLDDTQAVDKMHALALKLGAANEGDTGPRSETQYAGFFRDLDGNKLNVYCRL